jgi:WD40 repeat protein
VTPDGYTLVAGGLQRRAILFLDAASLLPLGIVGLGSDASALAFGRGRALFAATTACEILTLRLTHAGDGGVNGASADSGGGGYGGGSGGGTGSGSGGGGYGCGCGYSVGACGGCSSSVRGAVVTSVNSAVHTSVADAMAVSPDGSMLVSAGTDTMVRVWRAADMAREGAREAPSHERCALATATRSIRALFLLLFTSFASFSYELLLSLLIRIHPFLGPLLMTPT